MPDSPCDPSLSLQRLEGDLELLAVFTHVVMAVSVAALLLTAAILLSLRSLKSNMRGIHANVAAAALWGWLSPVPAGDPQDPKPGAGAASGGPVLLTRVAQGRRGCSVTLGQGAGVGCGG